MPKILGRSQKNDSFRRFQEFNGHYMVTLWGSWQLPLFSGGKPLLRPRGPWASRCPRCRIMAARVHQCRRAVRTDRLRALWNCGSVDSGTVPEDSDPIFGPWIFYKLIGFGTNIWWFLECLGHVDDSRNKRIPNKRFQAVFPRHVQK